VNEKWVAPGAIFRNVNRSEQMHAISHRDAVFVFCVMLLDIELGSLWAVLSDEVCRESNNQRDQSWNMTAHEAPWRHVANRQNYILSPHPSSLNAQAGYNRSL